jgi:hypothetical protein
MRIHSLIGINTLFCDRSSSPTRKKVKKMKRRSWRSRQLSRPSRRKNGSAFRGKRVRNKKARSKINIKKRRRAGKSGSCCTEETS